MVVLPIFNQNMESYFRFSIKIRCKDTVFFLYRKIFFTKTALIAKFIVKMTDIMKYSIPKYLKRATKYANVSHFLLGMRILSSAMSPMNIG